MRTHSDCIQHLQAAGISYDDATALRRISMTLHRWHELECGDNNRYGSWAIVRGHMREGGPFQYREEEGRAYIERHIHTENKPRYELIPDRERGAIKRLEKIMRRYNHEFSYYIQTDPRGCSLYILRPGDVPPDSDVSSYYTRGIAVYK